MSHKPRNNRGIALLMSYLVLSMVLVYSNAMVLRTVTQRLAVERTRDRIQAQYLAQSAAEQMRVELEDFLVKVVYRYNLGNAAPALAWLNELPGGTLPVSEFSLPIEINTTTGQPHLVDSNHDGRFQLGSDLQRDQSGTPVRAGAPTNPLCLNDLPTIPGTAQCTPTTTPVTEPRAWIVSVCVERGAGPAGGDPNSDPDTTPQDCKPDVNPLARRIVTIQAEARVGSVTKRIQARYRFELPNASVFAYAYFINNHGWFKVIGSQTLGIFGDVRANGDLTFYSDQLNGSGEFTKIQVDGDLFAAANTHVSPPETGDILPASNSPIQTVDWTAYWASGGGGSWKRTALRLVAPNLPLIVDATTGSPALGQLGAGSGWDTAYQPTTPNQDPVQHPKTDQERHPGLAIHDMPYLGDLSLYESIAEQYNYNAGSTLTYYPYNLAARSFASSPVTIHSVFDPALGPDQQAGTADDGSYPLNYPLIVVGDGTHPVIIHGPVVAPGDVLIKAWDGATGGVRGVGTIYAGRNIHIVGEVKYHGRPSSQLQRDANTGRIRKIGVGPGPGDADDLGQVCRDGRYHLPSAPVSAAACQ